MLRRQKDIWSIRYSKYFLFKLNVVFNIKIGSDFLKEKFVKYFRGACVIGLSARHYARLVTIPSMGTVHRTVAILRITTFLSPPPK